LSLDNIIPLITGASRKKDKPEQALEEPLLGRWSMVDPADGEAEPERNSTSTAPAPSIHSNPTTNHNNMALPSIRTLRSKFAVGAVTKGGMLASAKADLAARHAAKEKAKEDEIQRKKLFEEALKARGGRGAPVEEKKEKVKSLPPKAGDRRGFQGGSLGRAMGRSLKDRDEENEERRERVQSAFCGWSHTRNTDIQQTDPRRGSRCPSRLTPRCPQPLRHLPDRHRPSRPKS